MHLKSDLSIKSCILVRIEVIFRVSQLVESRTRDNRLSIMYESKNPLESATLVPSFGLVQGESKNRCRWQLKPEMPIIRQAHLLERDWMNAFRFIKRVVGCEGIACKDATAHLRKGYITAIAVDRSGACRM